MPILEYYREIHICLDPPDSNSIKKAAEHIIDDHTPSRKAFKKENKQQIRSCYT